MKRHLVLPIAILLGACNEQEGRATGSAASSGQDADRQPGRLKARPVAGAHSSDLNAGTDAFREMDGKPDQDRWRNLFRSFSRLAEDDPRAAVALMAAWKDNKAAQPFLHDLIACLVDRARLPDYERELVNTLKGSEHEGFVLERLVSRYIAEDFPWAFRYFREMRAGIHRQNASELIGEACARDSPVRFAKFLHASEARLDGHDCLRSFAGMLTALSDADHPPDTTGWLKEITECRLRDKAGELAARKIGSLETGPPVSRMEANAAVHEELPEAGAWHWQGILSTLKIGNPDRLREIIAHQQQYYFDDEASWRDIIKDVAVSGDAELGNILRENLPAGNSELAETLRMKLADGK